MKILSFRALALALSMLASLLLPRLSLGAGEDPGDQPRITGNQLRAMVVDQTWYGFAVEGGFTWVEYYSPDGDAFYRDENGFLFGTWEIKGEEEICFHYPALDTFCFAALKMPSGQVAIYDLERKSLIHMTTRIVPGDPERLADQPEIGDLVGD